LHKFEGLSVDDVSSDILFEELDDLQGLLIHLDGSHKQLVAEALVVEKGLNLSGDLILSSLVPGQVILGVL
jgi:hypothetical protein